METDEAEFCNLLMCSLLPGDLDAFDFDVPSMLMANIKTSKRISHSKFKRAKSHYLRIKNLKSANDLKQEVLQCDVANLTAYLTSAELLEVLDRVFIEGSNTS